MRRLLADLPPGLPIRIAVGTLLALLALGVAPEAQATLRSQERDLLTAVNHMRAARGLRPLRVDPALTRAARTHSRRLLERDVVAHGAVAARLASFGARGPAYGENLAVATGSATRTRVILRAWLANPGHRANVLRPGWRRMGIGAAVGEFAGSRATVVTADFAGS